MFDAVVVGGGAAGMMAAITAAERGKHVLLLEKNAQLGRKIRITGKGRCNVTNNCEPRTVIESTPGNGRFLYGAVNHFTPQDTMDFFEGLGVPLKTERGNRVFPVSDNAHDIADALWKKLKKCRVEIRQGNVKEVLTENGSVIGVRTENDVFEAPQRAFGVRRRFVPRHGLERRRRAAGGKAGAHHYSYASVFGGADL